MDNTTVIRIMAGVLFAIVFVFLIQRRRKKPSDGAAREFLPGNRDGGPCDEKRAGPAPGGRGRSHYRVKAMKRTLCVFNRNRESFLGLRVAPADTLIMRLKDCWDESAGSPTMASGWFPPTGFIPSACCLRWI